VTLVEERSCSEVRRGQDIVSPRWPGRCRVVDGGCAHPFAALSKGRLPVSAGRGELALAEAFKELVLDGRPGLCVLEDVEDDAERLGWRKPDVLADEAADLGPLGRGVDREQLRENVGVALDPGRTRG
jgi:hypothetical protein